jgi:hypothetical protein
MGWTAPSTVAAGDAILASLWNEQVRDNMSSLVEAGSTLPVSPVDGQSFYYIADSGTGTIWHMRYRATSTKWEFVGGTPLTLSYLAETTVSLANVTWGSLGSNNHTLTAPVAGTYLVQFTATLVNTALGTVYTGFKVGATAPTTTSNSQKVTVNPAGAFPNVAHTLVLTTSSASVAIEVQYYQTSGGAANVGRSGATLSLQPIKIG